MGCLKMLFTELRLLLENSVLVISCWLIHGGEEGTSAEVWSSTSQYRQRALRSYVASHCPVLVRGFPLCIDHYCIKECVLLFGFMAQATMLYEVKEVR